MSDTINKLDKIITDSDTDSYIMNKLNVNKNVINMITDRPTKTVPCCVGTISNDNLTFGSTTLTFDECNFPTSFIQTTGTQIGNPIIEQNGQTQCNDVMTTYCAYKLRDYMRDNNTNCSDGTNIQPCKQVGLKFFYDNNEHNSFYFNQSVWANTYPECSCYPFTLAYPKIEQGISQLNCIYNNCGSSNSFNPDAYYQPTSCNLTICTQENKTGSISATDGGTAKVAFNNSMCCAGASYSCKSGKFTHSVSGSGTAGTPGTAGTAGTAGNSGAKISTYIKIKKFFVKKFMIILLFIFIFFIVLCIFLYEYL